MPHGWIILDKPVGLGSTQAVAVVKRNLREAGYGKKVKVGHGGTLDPLAEGVLPIAIDPANWDFPADEALMQELQDGRTNLLFVGRLSPNKRQDHLIEAFTDYLRFDPTARLILVGDGGLFDPYRWRHWHVGAPFQRNELRRPFSVSHPQSVRAVMVPTDLRPGQGFSSPQMGDAYHHAAGEPCAGRNADSGLCVPAPNLDFPYNYLLP